MKRNIPKTHLLQTLKHSGMSQKVAIAEFIDNSFGEAAGAASTFTLIQQGSKKLIFLDDGGGISDVNLLFILGGSDSSNSDVDIGRFGSGSKFGALTFGTKVTVETIYNNVYHKYTVDWDYQEFVEQDWPVAYEGAGLPVSKAPAVMNGCGSMITIEDLKPKPRLTSFPSLSDDMGLMFAMALKSGKTINLIKSKGKKLSIASLIKGKLIKVSSLFDTLSLDFINNFKGVVNSKTYTMQAGVLEEYKPKYSGIHIYFGGRTIAHLTKLNNIPLPSLLFAFIALDSFGWKHSLNYNKTSIVEDGVELESAILNQLQPLITKLQTEKRETRIDLLFSDFQLAATAAFKDLLEGTNATQEPDGVSDYIHSTNPEPTPPGPDPIPRVKPLDINKDKKGEHKPSVIPGLEVKIKPSSDLGHMSFKTAMLIEGKKCTLTIELNTSLPVMQRALDAPVNSDLVVSVVATATASALLNNPHTLSELVPTLIRDFKIDDDDHENIAIAVHSKVMTTIAPIKDPTNKQIQEEQND